MATTKKPAAKKAPARKPAAKKPAPKKAPAAPSAWETVQIARHLGPEVKVRGLHGRIVE